MTADGGRDADSFVVVCLEQLGSYAFVDFATSQNLVKDVQAATEDGLGPHAVILVAVNEKPFQQAAEVSSPHPHPPTHPPTIHTHNLLTRPQYVRPRGTVICIGLPAGAYLRAPVFESVIKMITIRGSYVGNRKDSSEAIEFFRRGVIKAPFKTVGLSELQSVYDMMHKGQIAGRYVVDTSK